MTTYLTFLSACYELLSRGVTVRLQSRPTKQKWADGLEMICSSLFFIIFGLWIKVCINIKALFCQGKSETCMSDLYVSIFSFFFSFWHVPQLTLETSWPGSCHQAGFSSVVAGWALCRCFWSTGPVAWTPPFGHHHQVLWLVSMTTASAPAFCVLFSDTYVTMWPDSYWSTMWVTMCQYGMFS